jgi:cytochrome c peroxidase
MRFHIPASAILVAGLPLALLACKEEKPAPSNATIPKAAQSAAASKETASTEVDPGVLRLFAPLPAEFVAKDVSLAPERIDLGRQLYYDTRLSKSQGFSCNTCHLLDKYGVDGTPTSEGHKKQKGPRNSPSVYNAAGQFVQFWDGRAPTVEEQAKGPITNPIEMAMPDPKYVETVLNSIPGYVAAFKKAFPNDKNPVTIDNAAKAIGAFERKLVTPGRFDKFLNGDSKAITDEEKAGLKLFVSTGCTTCHSGALVGGTTFQKLGNVEPWPDEHDKGRFDQTKNDADKMMFKVPSLRNVEKTAPYFHDGMVPTLERAVVLMGKHQLGKDLNEKDVASIIAFLKTLTGDLPPAAMIAKPELPAGGPKTPKPEAG